MVHIADATFYAEVRDRLNRCDVLFVEGVRSFRARLLTLAYKIPAKRRSLGLVLQSHALRRSDLSGVVIHGDVNADAFSTSWAEIPWAQRMALLLLAPLYGVALYLFASREFMSRGHSVDSLPAIDHYAMPKHREVILENRDRHIIQKLETFLADNANNEHKLAILFGGGHMPAIASALTSKHGYKVVSSDWVTAIAVGA